MAGFDDIIEFAELEQFIDTQVRSYSSGMYVRLGFAVAINVDPDMLLVDEVLAVGDENFQRKCMERVHQLQREGRTIVVVSMPSMNSVGCAIGSLYSTEACSLRSTSPVKPSASSESTCSSISSNAGPSKRPTPKPRSLRRQPVAQPRWATPRRSAIWQLHRCR